VDKSFPSQPAQGLLGHVAINTKATRATQKNSEGNQQKGVSPSFFAPGKWVQQPANKSFYKFHITAITETSFSFLPQRDFQFSRANSII
jgi:hypothetical protein